MKPIYNIMFVFSLCLVIFSVVALAVFGLKLGVDFKGGSIIDLTFKNRPASADFQKAVTDAGVKDASISPVGGDEYIIRAPELTEVQHQAILSKIKTAFPNAASEEKSFDSVGPLVGNELRSKSITAIILVLIAITIYIAIVFRKLARLFSPWVLGLAALLALFHDIFLPVGAFALLGHFKGIEISAVFVAAMLTILGYSVSDTVVVFDRVRENVIRYGMREDLGSIVHKSIMQTLTRSLSTNFTVLLSLVAIYLFGGESVKYFALALIIGIFSGAYSSIFVASPILVYWWRWQKKS